tara:strand:+ start:117 stop:332 length:216 start_codon:yes stop_codon:yes gene_type:complete
MIITISLEDHEGNIVECLNEVNTPQQLGNLMYGLSILSQADSDFDVEEYSEIEDDEEEEEDEKEQVNNRWN